MILPGEIYMADIPPGQQHPVVVVSREELNRGDYVVAALITSQRFAVRSKLANCVPLLAGQFGMTKDSVVQGEMAGPIRKDVINLAAGPVSRLDDRTLREVIKAIGYVLDADCEPN
jgi:mRNA-degrading endonuclease toxin of MazEF toxin-antitoxin module